MTIERRGRNAYVYRKERVGDTVRSVYIGRERDVQAGLAHYRRQRARKTRVRQQLQALTEALDVYADSLRLVHPLRHAALTAAGFHQHARQWRRARPDRRALEAGLSTSPLTIMLPHPFDPSPNSASSRSASNTDTPRSTSSNSTSSNKEGASNEAERHFEAVCSEADALTEAFDLDDAAFAHDFVDLPGIYGPSSQAATTDDTGGTTRWREDTASADRVPPGQVTGAPAQTRPTSPAALMASAKRMAKRRAAGDTAGVLAAQADLLERLQTSSLWADAPVIMRHAMYRVLAQALPGDEAAQREMVKAASDYYVALKSESTSALTHLQALEVAHSWLQLAVVRFWHAKVSFAGSATSEAGPHWDRRLTSAQRRFDRATKTLAETQRLLARVPQLQINIANQQIVGETHSAR